MKIITADDYRIEENKIMSSSTTKTYRTAYIARWLLLLAIALGPAAPLAAQKDPFGDSAPGGGDPFGSDPSDTPAAGTDDKAKPKRPRGEEKDPVVLAVRSKNPQTPPQLTEAMQMMLDYGRSDEALVYLEKLMAAKPDEKALADLQQQFGSALFLRLKREESLAPQGPLLGKAVLDAAYKAARDPAYVNKLIAQLNDPSAEVRQLALTDLKESGDAAVGPLISVLADPKRAAEHARARLALETLGSLVVEDPLIGVLESPDPALRAQVFNVLGRLESRRVVPYLLRPYLAKSGDKRLGDAAGRALVRILGTTANRYDAERYLYRRAQAHLEGQLPADPDFQNNIRLWHWDAKQQTSVPREYLAKDAALVTAARIAAELYGLAPDNKKYRRLYLTALLEAAKFVGGLDRPLDPQSAAKAAAIGPDALEDLLHHAMRDDRVAAASAAAELLGQVGDIRLLVSPKQQSSPRPLAAALANSDRRVRMAAATAILRIDPQSPFAGCSRLPAALGYAIRTVGTPRVLIVHPRSERAGNLAGMFNELGYDADTALIGNDAVRAARRHPDYELMLISDAIDHPKMGELVQLLRGDTRTAKLPIGLMARAGKLQRAKQLAAFDPLTVAFLRPHTVPGLSFEARHLMQRIGRRHVVHQQRLRQAATALDQVAHLLENPHRYSFYNLLRVENDVMSAIHVPELSLRAIKVLGLLSTPKTQHALVDYASANALPLKRRQAAAVAFAAAVQRRGILLTKGQIEQQYDRYNQSEKLDRETQAVLGAVLDAIEVPSRGDKNPAAEENP